MIDKSKITTIKLSEETKQRLNHLKEHEKESYDSVLKKMLYILNTFRKEPIKARSILKNIDLNIRKREGYTKEQKKDTH